MRPCVDRDTISLAEGSSITSDGAVINGERDLYRFEATGGAERTVTITSLEDNAVFEIYAPDGSLLIGDSASFSVAERRCLPDRRRADAGKCHVHDHLRGRLTW